MKFAVIEEGLRFRSVLMSSQGLAVIPNLGGFDSYGGRRMSLSEGHGVAGIGAYLDANPIPAPCAASILLCTITVKPY
ncbi:hypothetical protein [Puniceicoccus vermicola]|uniref:Uncharacterized protein n=1 Tax=Puniceicoccus vermicola TaxID=388746 RepID=A0A7X1AZD1_9BACT|nr:hypothetical protein [Puniceicoccus vermicola]MBC2601738.1 hypothetical protein [Puniceicoccus vermicola]